MVTVFFFCLWVWKGKVDTSEAVYRLGSGPWRQNLVGFWVSRAAETLRLQLNEELLPMEVGVDVVGYIVFLVPMGMERQNGHE